MELGQKIGPCILDMTYFTGGRRMWGGGVENTGEQRALGGTVTTSGSRRALGGLESTEKVETMGGWKAQGGQRTLGEHWRGWKALGAPESMVGA